MIKHHKKCATYYRTGDCIMPKEDVFLEVLTGSIIKINDDIVLVDSFQASLNIPKKGTINGL